MVCMRDTRMSLSSNRKQIVFFVFFNFSSSKERIFIIIYLFCYLVLFITIIFFNFVGISAASNPVR